MITLKFKKLFVRGNLKGLTTESEITFVNHARMELWIDGISKRDLNWKYLETISIIAE